MYTRAEEPPDRAERGARGNRGTALADAVRPGKEVRMGNPIIGQGLAQYRQR